MPLSKLEILCSTDRGLRGIRGEFGDRVSNGHVDVGRALAVHGHV